MSRNVKQKYRDFTFILYPESIPEDWERRLRDTGIEMAISPLHDKDKFEGEKLEEIKTELEHQKVFNGWTEERYAEELDKCIWKKPHYHVIYVAKNSVTTDAVRKRIQRVLGKESVSKVKPIYTNIKNTYEYLTHESKSAIEDGKHIYDKKDIKHLNGFDINNYVKFSKGEENNLANEILKVIRDYEIENYFDLEDKVEEIERLREWKKRDMAEEKKKKIKSGEESDPKDFVPTEEQEKEMLEAYQKKVKSAETNEDEEEADGELTLNILRRLYRKNTHYYNSLLNANYQRRKRAEEYGAVR